MIYNRTLLDLTTQLYRRYVALISDQSLNFKESLSLEIGQWEENYFSTKKFPDWSSYGFELREILEGLPEWQNTLEEIKNDPVIMEHVGKCAGNPTGVTVVRIDEAVLSLLTSLLAAHNGLAPDPIICEKVFSEFERFFHQENINVTCRVILDFFELIGFDTLTLEEKVQVRKLGLEDINKLYRELFDDQSPTFFMKDNCYEVRINFITKKVVYDSAQQKISDFKDPQYSEILANINQVLTSIKLSVGGSLKQWLVLYEHHAWAYGGGFGSYNVPERMRGWANKSIVKPDDVALITDLLNIIKNEDFKKNSALQIAFRRLLFSLDRDRYDDRLIDTMIGFEALFFQGQDERGELRYRFSQRTAFFLEDDPNKRQEKFEMMKKAYDLRSTLVHGNNPRDSVKVNNRTFQIKTFIDLIQEDLRLSIIKFLKLPAESRPTTSDHWNKVLIGGVQWISY